MLTLSSFIITELKIVANLKYLGILFSKNGNFYKQGRQYYQKAQGQCFWSSLKFVK